jgi:hypothetical protein
MTNTLNLQGMERWPMTEAGETNHSQLLFSMVIFSPLKDVPEQVPSRSKITRAHTLADNGFSMTSQEFQEKVKQYPKVLITSEKCEMTLFRLIKGRIKLMTVFDLTGSKLESNLTWKTYTYCKFPYACNSMEKIESFANDLPILRLLLLSSLPLTPCPLEWKQSASSMSGLIVGDRRLKMTSSSWLSTDEIQLLFAFLMCNIDGNTGFLHVLSSSITKNIHDIHDLMPVMMEKKEDAPQNVIRTYQMNLDAIFKYIESRLHILEHKFLIFLCNTNRNHLVSVVVINPFFVVELNKKTGHCTTLIYAMTMR